MGKIDKKIKKVVKRFWRKNKVYSIDKLPLCYHSVSNEVNEHIHRLPLNQFENQLVKLKKRGFTFVPIDEYLRVSNRRKVCSITFDDGYKDVLLNASPILESLDIPFTLFLTSSVLESKLIWRDKVRLMLDNGLIDRFESFLQSRSSRLLDTIDFKTFYKSSKKSGINSKELSTEIDCFFQEEGFYLTDNNLYLSRTDLDKFPKNLMSIGNHTENHYVLSSLRKEEQLQEIVNCQEVLDNLSLPKSNTFAFPFGGFNSFNQDTLDIVESMSFDGVVITDRRPIENAGWPVDFKRLKATSRYLPKYYD